MVFDLCMAPGGFTATAAKELPRPLIDAVTLPPESGGYEVLAKEVCRNIIYADITMYSTEMACEELISTEHPDCKKFKTCRPFLGNLYDIVICDGAVGKDHLREGYRGDCEPQRLTVSQLVFAINRLKPGGSVVLLLHRVESWDTVCILHAFSQFSDIQLYKHTKIHSIKSSFYLVAKNINLDHHAARESIASWKSLWKYLTFKDFESIPLPQSSLYGTDDGYVRTLRDGFGAQFLRIAHPIWQIQAEALRKASFSQPTQRHV
jgi:23S rRNA U2552 (ribose-2'-O)-methylase RlmE/FtsJ